MEYVRWLVMLSGTGRLVGTNVAADATRDADDADQPGPVCPVPLQWRESVQ